jgi:hypothetical protein
MPDVNHDTYDHAGIPGVFDESDHDAHDHAGVPGIDTPPESYDDAIAALSASLVHRWKFAEASGDFADSVGSLTLTASGSITYHQAAPNGSTDAAKFASGARGAAGSMGSAPTGAGARTCAFIYKSDGALVTNAALFGYGTTSSTRQWWAHKLNDGASYSESAATWSDDLIIASSGLSDGQWHFVAIAYDGGSTLYLFRDGVLHARRLGAALNTGTTNKPKAPYDNLAAYLDDVAIWSRCLKRWEMDRLWDAAEAAIKALG